MNITTPGGYSGLSAVSLEPHRYAAYTCANHEKRVTGQIEQRSIEYFLPLYDSVRRWKDRKMHLRMPIFLGYIFVRLVLCNRLEVLQIPSVVRLVGFNGLPTMLPDDEIEALRNGLTQRLRAEPFPFLTAGRHVRIRRGPLAGLEGVLLRKEGQSSGRSVD